MNTKTNGQKSFIFKIIKWIPALIIFCTSWILSSKEKVEFIPNFWSADKLVHLICFAALCFWVSFACNIKKIYSLWIPSTIVSIYGIIDEIHQSLVPGRTASTFDWIADSIGAIAGAVLFLALSKLFHKIFSDKR